MSRDEAGEINQDDITEGPVQSSPGITWALSRKDFFQRAHSV